MTKINDEVQSHSSHDRLTSGGTHAPESRRILIFVTKQRSVEGGRQEPCLDHTLQGASA